MALERAQPLSLTGPVRRAKAVLDGHGDPTGRNYESDLERAQARLGLTVTKLRTLVGRTTLIGDKIKYPLSIIELPQDSPIGKKLAVVVEFPRPESRLRDHAAATDEGPRFRRLVEISDSTSAGNPDLIRVSTPGYVGQVRLFHEPNPPITVIDALAQFSNDLIADMPEQSAVPTPEAVRAQRTWLDEMSHPRYEDTHPFNGGAL